MNLLNDIITYIRRIIKSPSNSVISDNLIIDYINRFWIMDLSARMQHFDLKTKYAFQTVPGVDQYNMPLYNIQPNPSQASTSLQSDISFYPVYQGFLDPCYVNGVVVPLQTQKNVFFNNFPNIVQNLQVVEIGNGTNGPYNFFLPILANLQPTPINPPVQGILRGHVDMAGVISTGNNVDPPLGSTLDLNIPSTSIYPAVYITSIGNQGQSVVVQDSGQFLSSNVNEGLLMKPGPAPFGYSALPNGYTQSFTITGITQANPAVITAINTLEVGQLIEIDAVVGMTELNNRTFTVTAVTGTTVTIDVDSTLFTAYGSGGTISSLLNIINYFTGEVRNLFFDDIIPQGANINVQCYLFQTGLPRAILFNNNTLTLRNPPDRQYLIELDAYLTPSAFLTTDQAVPYAYMSEYIARGAARKILSDTGDIEQFQFYEPLFREQELLVWKRSQRQWTNNRTQTIYSQGQGLGIGWSFNNFGGST